MHPESSIKCERLFLLIITALFEILGICGIAYAIYTLATSTNGESLQAIDLMIGGIALIVISGFGFYGSYKEKLKVVKAYGGMLIVLVAFKTFFFVLGAAMQKKTKYSPEEVRSWFDRYGYNTTSTAIVDELQKTLHCCGYTGPQSIIRPDGTYPSSCCSYTATDCYMPYTSGCEPLLSPSRGIGFWIAFFVVIILQIVSIIAAFRFAGHLQKKNQGDTVPFSAL